MKRIDGAEYEKLKHKLEAYAYSRTKRGNLCVYYKGFYKRYLNDDEKATFNPSGLWDLTKHHIAIGSNHQKPRLELLGINSNSRTAGPGGERYEIFTKGCIRGMTNPCAGCFNESSWSFSGESRTTDIDELHQVLKQQAHHKRFTICGGEPMLQLNALLPLLRKLKKDGFHVVMYTAYDAEILLRKGLHYFATPDKDAAMVNKLNHYAVETVFKGNGSLSFKLATPDMVRELFSLIDILIDGDYQQTSRLTTARFMEEDWFIGSANQRLIDTKASLEKDELVYVQADEAKELAFKE